MRRQSDVSLCLEGNLLSLLFNTIKRLKIIIARKTTNDERLLLQEKHIYASKTLK